LLENPDDITHLTLGMLLHYLGKLKLHQIFLLIMKKKQTNPFLIASTFVIQYSSTNVNIFGV